MPNTQPVYDPKLKTWTADGAPIARTDALTRVWTRNEGMDRKHSDMKDASEAVERSLFRGRIPHH